MCLDACMRGCNNTVHATNNAPRVVEKDACYLADFREAVSRFTSIEFTVLIYV